jgi:uncharacterized protein YegL
MTVVPLPLIKAVSPVQPGMPTRRRAPNVAVVYATAGGQLGSFDDWRPMTYREQLMSKYRTRYDVDMGDHRRRARLESIPLPSRGDYYFFIADLEVAFRVHDPIEIVRRNITDATTVVYSHLASEFRRITRKYDIEEADRAEADIAHRFDVDDILADGIKIFSVVPRLLPDDRAMRHLQERKEAERRVLTDLAQHRANLLEARHRGELEQLNREFERKQADQEMERMGDRELDAVEIVRRHLARHPDDTEKALALFNEHHKAWLDQQDLYNRRTTQFFESLAERNLVHAADVEALLPRILENIGFVPSAVQATVADWTDPPVLSPEGDTQEAQFVEGEGGRRWTPADGLHPVYVLIDESEDAVEHLYHMDTGLIRMLAAIAAEDDIAPGIRLAILGYADHLTVRLPLTLVTAQTEPPHLVGGGAAGYAAMFETLAERIDQDIAELGEAQSNVRDPMVYLLSASPASDNWAKPRQRLVDSHLHRHIPTIVAFGIGDATPDVITGIATRRGDAYMALPGTEPAIAIDHFCDYVTQAILSLGHRLTDERALPDLPAPEGFIAWED